MGSAGGSGRDTVESCRSIDVSRLHRAGCLRAGWMGGWQWTRDGEKVASINLRAEHDRVHLTYRVRRGGGEWEDVAETARTVRVPCRLGGTRPYFICPGVVNGVTCGRRVAKLHGPGRYFLCRHCYRLAHASQSEGIWDRTLRRANKIRQRLGGDPGLAAPFPPKPPDDLDEGEAPYGADSDHLRRFVETQVLPWYDRRRTELANRPLIREQAFGESLDAEKLEVLGRYEVHLDRKLERMLAMLLRLKDLRQMRVEPEPLED